MPKKLFTTEPPVIFDELLAEFVETFPGNADEGEAPFSVKTDDPVVPSFSAELINTHYPPQSQLPLD